MQSNCFLSATFFWDTHSSKHANPPDDSNGEVAIGSLSRSPSVPQAESPSCPEAIRGQKRAADTNLTDYAKSLSRNVRLKPAQQDELQGFAKVNGSILFVWLSDHCYLG
jgi:hypothetical protein